MKVIWITALWLPTAIHGFVLPTARRHSRFIVSENSASCASLSKPLTLMKKDRRVESDTSRLAEVPPMKRFSLRLKKNERRTIGRIIFCLALASALWVTPADAKGGGHGGGHSSHSSRSSSSRSSTHSSAYRAPRSSPRSSPPPRPSYKATSPPSPSIARPTPSPSKRTKTRVYGHIGGRARRSQEAKSAPPGPSPPAVSDVPVPAPVIRHHYHYDDSSPSIYFRRQPRPIVVQDSYVSPIAENALPPVSAEQPAATAVVGKGTPMATSNPWSDRLGGVVVGGGLSTALYATTNPSSKNHNEDTEDDLLLTKQVVSPSFLSTTSPIARALNSLRASGWYRGETTESDGMEQSIRVRLQFTQDGLVRGHGHDEQDGDYTINLGIWKDDRACWLEEYHDEDYVVLVYAQRVSISDTHAKMKWKCTFVSSVERITGNFELTKTV